jgi:hypothetical protein
MPGRISLWLWVPIACLLPARCIAQTDDPSTLLDRLQQQIRDAQEAAVAIYAPAHYENALKQYGDAVESQRSHAASALIQERIDAAQRALSAARSASDAVRKQMAAAIGARDAALQLDPSIAQQSGSPERMFRQAAAQAEVNAAAAPQAIERARTDYMRAGIETLRDANLPKLKKNLEAARDTMTPQAYTAAASATSALERRLAQATDLASAIAQFGDVLKVFPPEFRNPPTVLTIGDFTLYVDAYETKGWDFKTNRIIKASGKGSVSFRCGLLFPFLNVGVLTVQKSLRVVQAVRDPATEISLADALAIDPSQGLNSVLPVKIPSYATSARQISEAVADLVRFGIRPRGDIDVSFADLVIQPGPEAEHGIVLAGSASYPTVPPHPDPITLRVSGFSAYLSKLTITPTGNQATGDLEFPVSIVDPGTGHPGRIALGDFAITSACEFHKQLPALSFGPWSVGNTDMRIQGTGVTADFDKAWAAPGLDPLSAAALAPWKGAILDSGNTVPASGPIVSNSGYLRANYTFAKAEVTSPGLHGTFQLSGPFEFTSFEPVGYAVRLANGSLVLTASAVDHGQFLAGTLIAPAEAVRTNTNARVTATYQIMNVDANLDLLSDAKVNVPMRWGELTQTPGRPRFYEASGFTRERFYLAGTYKSNYFPLDPGGDFLDPQPISKDLRLLGMQGLTVGLPQHLTIFTSDTPGAKPIAFHSNNEGNLNWLNISFGGVHGVMNGYITDRDTPTDLGPVAAPFYVGKVPFKAATTIAAAAPVVIRSDYALRMSFVTSAVYDCNMSGKFHIPAPADSDLEFSNLAFTSTALISGAKAPFNSPFKLSYWGVDMVKKPGATAGAVISIRTGQVFFTAAGIREPRHYAVPFYLIWGEMLANGALNRLVFDYAGVGQKFDRFPFTVSFVRLSDYDPAKDAFIKVAGTAHFDVFGPKYLNIQDAFDPSKPGDPYNNRRIDALSTDADAGGLFQASDQHLAANWSSDFGSMNFNYDYDKNAQDGFTGAGKMGFLWISGDMSSSIVLKAERTCMSVNETAHHDVTLGPVAHFGSMTRTTGCGCLEGGQLQRFMLSAELENTGDVNIVLRSASYGRVEWSLTPSVSTLEVDGDMYLNVLVGGGLEITGKGRFTVNRDQDFVEGELDGSIDAGTALGISTLKADGQLNWHLGKLGGDSYQSLQGRLAVSVVSPAGGSGGEGGFYVGLNAPKSEAWVLTSGGDRYKLNTTPLPTRLTGVYGYVKASSSVDLFVLSGGIEAYAGVGGFVLTPAQVADMSAQASGLGPGLPFVVGNVGIHVWGSILGGFVSADGTVDLNIIAPYPFSFQGTLELEGCVLWVACKSVDLTVGLNSSQGLFVL